MTGLADLAKSLLIYAYIRMTQRGGFKVLGMELGRFGLTGDGLRTQLFTLIDDGSTEDFQTSLTEVLKKYPIDQITNKSGTHLLTQACIKNRLDIVEILKTNGADFSIIDSDKTKDELDGNKTSFPGFTYVPKNASPFLEAILTGNLALVQKLVEYGVNIFVKYYGIRGFSGPLMHALNQSDDLFYYLYNIYEEKCESEVFKNLLSECIPIACYQLKPQLLKLLFDKGAKLTDNLVNSDLPGSEVAHMIIFHRSTKEEAKSEMLKILINNGLDIHWKEGSLFFDAVRSRKNNSAKILIDNGATRESLGSFTRMLDENEDLAKYYKEASTKRQAASQVNQVAGKRTRRRGRGRSRKSQRRLRS